MARNLGGRGSGARRRTSANGWRGPAAGTSPARAASGSASPRSMTSEPSTRPVWTGPSGPSGWKRAMRIARIYRLWNMTSTAVPSPGTKWVDARLRDEIVSGALPPGTPLRAEELALRWSVSPTPVREALARLAGIGFVELRPQRGARVAEASLRDV